MSSSVDSPSSSYGLPFDPSAAIWADIAPTYQDDGPSPLCPILYSPAYSQAMDLLRSLLPRSELSLRALSLTQHLLLLNPSNYTVWNYRANILIGAPEDEEDPPRGLGKRKERLEKELRWIEELAKGMSMKNYQVWQHRRVIVLALADPSQELRFIDYALSLDSKNYHTWSYRSWVLSHFGGLPGVEPPSEPELRAGQAAFPALWGEELANVGRMLDEDCRNNSAWNHRWFCIFASGRAEAGLCGGRGDEGSGWGVGRDLEECVDKERSFALEHIKRTPNNASAWNYLRGLNRYIAPSTNPFSGPASSLSLSLVPPPSEAASKPSVDSGGRTPPFALEWLFDELEWDVKRGPEGSAAQDNDDDDKVQRATQLLKRLIVADPMRTRYWQYRAVVLRRAAGERRKVAQPS